MAENNQQPQAPAGARQNKQPKGGQGGDKAQPQDRELPSADRVFLRNRLFPEAGAMFTFRPPPLDKVKGECIVTFDTNALLLPYKTESRSLSDIGKALKLLAEGNRLRLAAQAVREYFDHQPNHLGGVLSAVEKARQALSQANPPQYPLLHDLGEYKEAVAQWEKMKAEVEEYGRRLKALFHSVRGWSGNDPVSELCRVVTPGKCLPPKVRRAGGYATTDPP
jgi:hypothetical protein